MLKVPENLHSHPEEHDRRNIYTFNFLVVHYKNVKHIKTKGGHDVHHVLIRPNWSRSPDCLDPFVAMLLHYCTLESALNYTKLSDHPATKKKADGSSSNVSPDSIIGQFDGGFYSAFMVADKIDVFTLSGRPDSVPLHWQSDGHGSYTIEEVPDKRMAPGTKVIVHLKASCAGTYRLVILKSKELCRLLAAKNSKKIRKIN